MKFQPLALYIALLTLSSGAWAVQVVQCEDDSGNRTFESACPPGTKQVGEKNYGTNAPATAESQAELSAVLYVIPDCDVCTQVREYLTFRQVSVSEKNVRDDVTLQNELKERAGHLRVPVTIIGDTVVTGYKREELAGALAALGYVEEGAAGAAEGEEAEAEETAVETEVQP